MYIDQMSLGSVAELVISGPLDLSCVCSVDAVLHDPEYACIQLWSVNFPRKISDEFVDIRIRNGKDGNVYEYPRSAVFQFKKNKLVVGSIYDIDFRNVRQHKRYTYSGDGVVIRNGLVLPMKVVDVSGTGIGFHVTPIDVQRGEQIFIHIAMPSGEQLYEQVEVVRTVKEDDGSLLVGCATRRSLVSNFGIQENDALFR